MQAYSIDYIVKEKTYNKLIDAKDLSSARKKLGRAHGYKDGRIIKIKNYSIIGYY